ncbi:uncharacterized protein LOC100184590 isoform X4 [Ciona intestinalis]
MTSCSLELVAYDITNPLMTSHTSIITDPNVYWSMDKTLGNQITPDIGNVAIFTFNTGGSFVNGYHGKALRLYQTIDTFNGVGAVADECVFEPAKQCNGGLTVATWLRPHAWGADTIIITTGKPPLLVPGFTIYPRTSIFQREIIADVISSSGTRSTATIDRDLIPLDTWTHLTMVWHETSGIKMYINGIEATYISSPASSSVSLSASPKELKFTFGSSSQQLDFDEVKLWYNPLTPTQVMRAVTNVPTTTTTPSPTTTTTTTTPRTTTTRDPIFNGTAWDKLFLAAAVVLLSLGLLLIVVLVCCCCCR